MTDSNRIVKTHALFLACIQKCTKNTPCHLNETFEKCPPCFLILGLTAFAAFAAPPPSPRTRFSDAPSGAQHAIVPTNDSSGSIAEIIGKLTPHWIQTASFSGGVSDSTPVTTGQFHSISPTFLYRHGHQHPSPYTKARHAPDRTGNCLYHLQGCHLIPKQPPPTTPHTDCV